jgi:hypothetical protein
MSVVRRGRTTGRMVGRIGTTQTTGAGGTRAATMTTQTTAPVRCVNTTLLLLKLHRLLAFTTVKKSENFQKRSQI